MIKVQSIKKAAENFSRFFTVENVFTVL